VAASALHEGGVPGAQLGGVSLGDHSSVPGSGLFALESADRPGEWVVVGPPPPPPPSSSKREGAPLAPAQPLLFERLGGPGPDRAAQPHVLQPSSAGRPRAPRTRLSPTGPART
jgi:hypothetical protein